MKVYLAGPDVFLPDAIEVGRRKKALCERYGFVGLFPFDNEIPKQTRKRADRLIFEANLAMMEQADAGVFNLTPFRGPSADVGTVFELGLMSGLRKPVFGYTTVLAPLLARVSGARRGEHGGWQDKDGYSVEDFGNADNLMIDGCLAREGNGIVRADGGGRLDDLEVFEACLRLAAERLRTTLAHRAQAVGQADTRN